MNTAAISHYVTVGFKMTSNQLRHQLQRNRDDLIYRKYRYIILYIDIYIYIFMYRIVSPKNI